VTSSSGRHPVGRELICVNTGLALPQVVCAETGYPQPAAARMQRRWKMSDKPDTAPERVPIMQRVLDNPFLLLFLGVTIPTVFYVIWGVMEIVQIPIAK
jgi:hypothetical protein